MDARIIGPEITVKNAYITMAVIVTPLAATAPEVIFVTVSQDGVIADVKIIGRGPNATNARMDFTTVHVGLIADNALTVKSVTKSTGRVQVVAILIFYHPCVKNV